jgi:hypothetical protein
MMFDNRIVWNSTVIRMMGLTIFFLLAVSLFDPSLLSKHDCLKIRTLKVGALKPALPKVMPNSLENRITANPLYFSPVMPQCPDLIIYRKNEELSTRV